MIIDIFKDRKLFANLEKINSKIIEVSSNYKYNSDTTEYDLDNNVISQWFDPNKIKYMPASRSYPEISKEQLKDDYNLVLYNGNYLPIYLINVLYANNKEVLIEDVGAGVGHFIVYLNQLGFNNFHIVENFSQMSQNSLELMMNYFSIKYSLNDSTSKPTIINNTTTEPAIVEIKDSTELVTCYTNKKIEVWANDYWQLKDFVFLCRDKDDFSFSWCRKNKYEEFISKLKISQL